MKRIHSLPMAHKKKLSKGSILAALDIGSTKIACFIARVLDDEGDLEVVGVGYQASKGVKSGAIMDLDAAETAIRKAVHSAENMAAEIMKGYPLRDIVLSVPAGHCRTDLSSVTVQVSGQDVTENDLRRAMIRGQQQNRDEEFEQIHTIPVSYALDGKTGIAEPKGLFGKELGVDITTVQAAHLPLKNMMSTVERSHLDVAGMCVGAYASGLSCLVEDEMNLGCTVLDIGGGTTSIAVFHGGKLIYAGAIPVGGSHVTNDVARGLNTPVNDAERIKTLYGSAMASSMDDSEMIDVPVLGEESGTLNHVPRSMLVGIIQPRLEEIFEMTRAKLDESGLLNYLGRNVVMTGGASQMPGMRELAQRYLDKQVRLGRPHMLKGVPDITKGPGFSNVSGLLMYMRDRFHEQPHQIITHHGNDNFIEKVKSWFQENW